MMQTIRTKKVILYVQILINLHVKCVASLVILLEIIITVVISTLIQRILLQIDILDDQTLPHRHTLPRHLVLLILPDQQEPRIM